MNQSFFQKLKRVRWFDLVHVIFFLIAFPIALCLKVKHKEIWLFSDCPDEARDNAYWLFRYVALKHPKQEIFFALAATSPDYEKVAEYGEIIEFGSFKHWVFYLAAKNVISSQKASGPNAAVCYLLERWKLVRGNKVFLQHGIIKDNISFLYYKYTKIRQFTCSVEREFEYVRQNYGYPAGYVKMLGLCRFDNLYNFKLENDLIVIMPTWRKWLSHPTEGVSNKQVEQLFLKSEYYKKWMHLLNSEKLAEVLEKENKRVIFYLHREAQRYTEHFKTNNNRIRIGKFPSDDVQELLKRAAFLITDYSSVAMDFAYMNKPVLYYQFDQEEFREKHLSEGYFDYKIDGFGPVCAGEDAVIDILGYHYQDVEESKVFAARRDSFFTLRDKCNCMRTYKAICEL